MKKSNWEVLGKITGKNKLSAKEIINILLKNRNLKTEKEVNRFFNPLSPEKIKLSDIGIEKKYVTKALDRLKKAKEKKEHIVVYGDYDTDGICATAIIWETLHIKKYDVLPYIPERFSEGYGLNPDSVDKLKNKNPNLGLIITVDNGIVAYEGIEKAKELGIDVLVIDHHQKEKKLENAFRVIHSDMVCGAALSWLFSREIRKEDGQTLELAAIGTISDQMPLTGVNRSFVKYGLTSLNQTKRMGLRAVMREARIQKVGVYEIGFVISPRLNAAGRLAHAIDSLRLVCTRNFYKANDLALSLGRINQKRQKIVEDVLKGVEKKAEKSTDKAIVVSDKNYHEGVIGLAAGRITDKYQKPSIVFSVKDDIAKASARSVEGFNIIKAIKKLKRLIIEGGGHPMAAGFSIETKNIEKFKKEINIIAKKEIKDKSIIKKIKIDLELDFNQLNQELMDNLKKLEPFGMGNPQPTFLTKKVKVLESKKVGQQARHLKLKLEKENTVFDAIAFNFGHLSPVPGNFIDLIYSLEENFFNGNKSLQLKVKDLRVAI